MSFGRRNIYPFESEGKAETLAMVGRARGSKSSSAGGDDYGAAVKAAATAMVAPSPASGLQDAQFYRAGNVLVTHRRSALCTKWRTARERGGGRVARTRHGAGERKQCADSGALVLPNACPSLIPSSASPLPFSGARRGRRAMPARTGCRRAPNAHCLQQSCLSCPFASVFSRGPSAILCTKHSACVSQAHCPLYRIVRLASQKPATAPSPKSPPIPWTADARPHRTLIGPKRVRMYIYRHPSSMSNTYSPEGECSTMVYRSTKTMQRQFLTR